MSLSGWVNKKQILFWLIGVFIIALTMALFSKDFLFFLPRYLLFGIFIVSAGIVMSYWAWGRWNDAKWDEDKGKNKKCD